MAADFSMVLVCSVVLTVAVLILKNLYTEGHISILHSTVLYTSSSCCEMQVKHLFIIIYFLTPCAGRGWRRSEQHEVQDLASDPPLC